MYSPLCATWKDRCQSMAQSWSWYRS